MQLIAPRCWPMLARFALLALFVLPLQASATEEEESGFGDDLLLEINLGKTRIYLGESVPLTATLLVGSVSLRNIQYPLIGKGPYRLTSFAPPRQDSVKRNGKEYTAHAFVATLTPNRSGALSIGPAELRGDLLQPGGGSAGFFGGVEASNVIVRAVPVSLAVLPLPTQGRPVDFGGALGRYTVTRTVSARSIRPGDPVAVTTRIEGVGNFYGLSCDPIVVPGLRAYPPSQRQQGKALICEQILVAVHAQAIQIPPVSVSFFDIDAARYGTSKTTPIRLLVETLPPVPAIASAPLNPSTPDSPAAAQRNVSYWLVATALALLGIGAIGWLSRNRRLTENPARDAQTQLDDCLDEAERALANADSARFYTAAFRLAQVATVVGSGADLPPHGVASCPRQPGSMDSDARMHQLAELFRHCDAVRYGRVQPDTQTMRLTYEKLRLQANMAGQAATVPERN